MVNKVVYIHSVLANIVVGTSSNDGSCFALLSVFAEDCKQKSRTALPRYTDACMSRSAAACVCTGRDVKRPSKEPILRYIICTGPRSPVPPLFIVITKRPVAPYAATER